MKKRYWVTAIVFLTSFLFLIIPAIPADFWIEDFSNSAEHDTSRPGYWSTSGAPFGDWYVWTTDENKHFWGRNLGITGGWTTVSIDISDYTDVGISVDIAESGSLEEADYIRGLYILDGGSEIEFFNQPNDCGSNWITKTVTGLSGSSLVVIIEADNSALNEEWFFDNVRVSGTLSGTATPTPTSTTTPTPTQTTTPTPTATTMAVKINYQPGSAPVPAGYGKDWGQSYGNDQEQYLDFGWN